MADKTDIDRDEYSGIETTGHEWDGIKELNNPLPRWWLWIFYACVVWAFGYWIAYPAIPLVSSHTKGLLGYSSRAEVGEALAKAQAAQSGMLDRIAAADLEAVATDPEMLQFAVAGGGSAFAVNCSQCHGAGAQGFPGYPNLNDDAWLWGGSLEAIYTTIRHGVRNDTDPDARYSEMPAFGRDQILERQQIREVVQYVLQISGQEHDATAAAAGMAVFAENCSACHGGNGEGMVDLGAPNLTDAIWLYGGDAKTLTETVVNARFGVMPAWGQRLDDVAVKQLAVYVHSLGGGQ